MKDISILYEDDCFLAVNKPPFIVVNRAESVKESTVQDWVEYKYPAIFKEKKSADTASDFISRSGIVHRIDKETSGILLIAKSEDIFLKLQQEFKERIIEKKYITLVHGIPPTSAGVINVNIGRLPWDREKFGIIPGGKEAVTNFKITDIFKTKIGDFCLLEVRPLTGRTHQIRVHLKYLGFPVVGDYLYAGRKVYKRDKRFCSRVFLHSSYMKLIHPQNGNIIEISCNLADDLTDVLKILRKTS